MSRSWRAAWILWGFVSVLALWGVADSPNRGDLGLLLRGSRVGAVEPGSAAARAGLARGQVVRLANGKRAADLRARLARLRPGEAVEILRGDPPLDRVRLVAEHPPAETVAWRVAWGLTAAGFLLLAAAVGRRRRDRVGFLFFVWGTTSALAVAPRPPWPIDVGAALHDALSSAAALFLPALLVHFFAVFPEGTGRRRTAAAAILYAAALALSCAAPAISAWWPKLDGIVLALGALVFAGGCLAALGSFVASYAHASPRHRRRLNLLLWSSACGLLPLAALTVRINLGSDPGAPAMRAAALLVLLVPAGFAYAIEVHQVFDFHWRRQRVRAWPSDGVPTSPPVFPAGDERAIVDAIAGDLHSRLGLAHCAAYRVAENGEPRLVTWLGDLPESGVPSALPAEVTRAAQRLARPFDLEELAVASGTLGAAPLVVLERAGARAVLPLFAQGQVAALVLLGPRLSDDLASPARRAGLSEYAAHASLAVEHAQYHDDRVHKARVDRELEVARGIQERLLPERDPVFPTLACAGASIPSGRVGGDYYDYLSLGPRRFGLAVADVCGKGVPAALLVAQVQAGLQRHAIPGRGPGGVLTALNQDLARFPQPEKFVCMSYAEVDALSRTVVWASAGLHPPLWVRPGEGVHELPTGDLILGVDPDTRYVEHRLQLEPGETVVFLTDGVHDARRGNEYFGGRRLDSVLRRYGSLRPPRLRDRILAGAREFHRTGVPDDMTVVVVGAF